MCISLYFKLLQCRWRIFKAKKRIRKIHRDAWTRENASLAIQRTWYRWRDQFHTFFLMSSYRARNTLDNEIRANKRRNKSSMRVVGIQRAFRRRYYAVIHAAAVTCQRWFRGCVGKRKVERMRVERIASRKIRHWARLLLRRRGDKARSIQRVWWRAGVGRRMRHLYYVAKTRDIAWQVCILSMNYFPLKVMDENIGINL